MILLSDIHGEHQRAFRFAEDNPTQTIVQLGDFGFGFKRFPKFPDNLFFIRGNHDDPAVCRRHPKYLGDFGYKHIDGKGVFFVSGADSIDKDMRIEGVSWWPDEELSYLQLREALDLYESVRPQMVISHDAPQSVVEKMFRVYDKTQTRQALQAMLDIHKPELWVFGHWHVASTILENPTTFICLPEFGTLKV